MTVTITVEDREKEKVFRSSYKVDGITLDASRCPDSLLLEIVKKLQRGIALEKSKKSK
jgi:hypothetical protein